MSVEDRLRNGLARNAASLHPQVEVQLNVVLRRTRRRNRLRWAGTALLVILVVPVVTALVAVLVGGRRQPAAPAPTTTTQETAPARQALTGSFTATVAATAPLAQQRGLAGAWTLHFQAEGNLTVHAPAEFPGFFRAHCSQPPKASYAPAYLKWISVRATASAPTTGPGRARH